MLKQKLTFFHFVFCVCSTEMILLSMVRGETLATFHPEMQPVTFERQNEK